MEDLARLKARIASLHELQGLFSAMQAMAASRMQAAQSTLGSIRAYTQEIEHAIADAVAIQPADPDVTVIDKGRSGKVVLVVCSEHGFTGSFNRSLLQRACTLLTPNDSAMVVGRRGAMMAAEFGIDQVWTTSMATHVEGNLVTARRVAARLSEAEAVHAVYGASRGGSRFEVEVLQLLPLAPSVLTTRNRGAPPLHQLAPPRLLHRLVGEYLLAELMLVLTESFTSENAARLQIMQAAGRNITDKLETAVQRSRHQRQEAITAELLEVVAGAEAVLVRSS